MLLGKVQEESSVCGSHLSSEQYVIIHTMLSTLSSHSKIFNEETSLANAIPASCLLRHST